MLADRVLWVYARESHASSGKCSTFSLWRSLSTDFHSGCTGLRSPLWHVKVISSFACHHLLSFLIKMFTFTCVCVVCVRGVCMCESANVSSLLLPCGFWRSHSGHQQVPYLLGHLAGSIICFLYENHFNDYKINLKQF